MFLQLKDREGKTVKRCQYTAIDDATRIRALQIFPEHNQECAIPFIDYVVEKFPLRISTVRTDRGMSKTREYGMCISDHKHPG